MLMRSTGLGETELVAEINECTRQGDHLILHLGTTAPIKWKVRATMTLKDMKKLIRVCMKMSIMLFVLNLSRWFREPEHPGDY